MIDPTNQILGLKMLTFTICIIICFFQRKHKYEKINYFFFMFITIYILYGILISYLNGKRLNWQFQSAYIQLICMSIFIFPLSRFSTDTILKWNFKIGIILAIIVIGCFIFYNSSEENGAALYYYVMKIQSVPTILISKRIFLGITFPAFFYKTAPFLLFPAIYQIKRINSLKDILLLFLFLIPIFITGSRTPMLCGLCILIYGILSSHRIGSLTKYLFSFILSLSFFILVFMLLSETHEESIMVKGGNTRNYISDITSSFSNLFLGSGIGSSFFDIRGYWVQYSELTYLDVYRYWGIIAGSVFIIFVFLPAILFLISSNEKMRGFALAYFLYMILAGTNPFLFSSTGWYCLIMGYLFLGRHIYPILR